MTKPKVFITRKLPTNLTILEQFAEIEVWHERTPPPYEMLREKVKSIDGLLCLLTDKIDQDLIQSATKLRVISQMAVGYDNIDVSAATAKKIPVGNTPGVLTDATADLTWALLMASARRIVEADKFTHARLWQTWEPDLLLGADVTGATLGIIGFGRIGQAVARRANGFNMQIIYTSKNRCDRELENKLNARFVSLETLLQESDFVTIHTPLTNDTHHLFGRAEFEMMKQSAILINTARGGVVNQDELYHALLNNHIACAVLDVTDPEPIPSNSKLLNLSNLVIAPHIGSASYKTRQKMADMAIENLIAGIQGEKLPYCINNLM